MQIEQKSWYFLSKSSVICSLILVLLVAACASEGNKVSRAQAVGIYIQEFERTEFIDCRTGNTYFVSNSNVVRSSLPENVAQPVVVEASLIDLKEEVLGSTGLMPKVVLEEISFVGAFDSRCSGFIKSN